MDRAHIIHRCVKFDSSLSLSGETFVRSHVKLITRKCHSNDRAVIDDRWQNIVQREIYFVHQLSQYGAGHTAVGNKIFHKFLTDTQTFFERLRKGDSTNADQKHTSCPANNIPPCADKENCVLSHATQHLILFLPYIREGERRRKEIFGRGKQQKNIWTLERMRDDRS